MYTYINTYIHTYIQTDRHTYIHSKTTWNERNTNKIYKSTCILIYEPSSILIYESYTAELGSELFLDGIVTLVDAKHVFQHLDDPSPSGGSYEVAQQV